MLLSLLQTPNRVDLSTPSCADAFLPFVKACTKSRVWKIRDAAGDALTGIVPPAEVAAVTIELLSGLETCKENEALAASLLDRRHSFPVRTTFFHIARVNLIASAHRPAAIFELAHAALEEFRTWDSTVAHLPGAESFVAAAFLFALAYDPTSTVLVAAGLETPLLSVQRAALAHLSPKDADDNISLSTIKLSDSLRPTLVKLAVSDLEASECRIAALEILVAAPWSQADEEVPPLLEKLSRQHAETIGQLGDISRVLDLIQSGSGVDESVESREASVRALRELRRAMPESQKEAYGRLVLRLLQDDDSTVRSLAEEIVEAKFSGGVALADRPAIEVVLASVGPAPLSQYSAEFAADLALLSNPSSLLFAIEKPNIFRDEMIETEVLLRSGAATSTTLEAVDGALASLAHALHASFGPDLDNGPLRIYGNELVCKWAYRLLSLRGIFNGGSAYAAGADGADELAEVLRRTYL
ncbi:hypothetical protein RQP46_004543 [Phenoliferia psychrophenolica]